LIKERLKSLENFLKSKFSNSWTSVRRAFLDLDMDHDGYISVEDLMKYYGADNELKFNDLKKLMRDKDSHGRGFLSY
jgi:Ca2+-binding EF-hand superfamily protein